jgi:putative spermidine/putrescine transport system permease protein
VAARTVTLPVIKPGVIAGATFGFITSFDELVVSLFLTGPRLSTLPVQIYNYIEFTSDPTIAAISALLIVLTVAAVLLVERLVGFTRFV